MHRRRVRNELKFNARRSALVLLSAAGLCLTALPSRAQTALGPVTLGAGMRTSFIDTEPDLGKSTDRFLLNSARLYVNGPVTGDIKFTLNTEYDSGTNRVSILDALARLEVAPEFNLWAGRLLPPSDRVNLTGPYYAHH